MNKGSYARDERKRALRQDDEVLSVGAGTDEETFSYPLERPHSLATKKCLEALRARPEGLGESEAAERRRRFGPNKLPEPDGQGVFVRFFKHFHDILIYILLAAALVTALMGHWIDTAVILAVVVINAVIGFLQEGKAEQALAGIRNMLSLHAHVLRGGDVVEIDAEELVPGDVVRLRSGDKVPADVRVLEATSLRIEESALTGESAPSEKCAEPVEPNAGVGDRASMAFSGSIVSSGRGTGVVVATGVHTEIGRINRMIEEVEQLATPLTRQMSRFGKILSVVILVMAAAMFAIGRVAHGWALDDLFFAAIGFAVAAIPEGLPAILSITLAIGVQRMAARKAITRRLTSVETLGSVTVICSDKTGTLTRNEMTAKTVVTGDAAYEVSGIGYAPEGDVRLDEESVTARDREDLLTLLEIMTVCNDASVRDQDGQWALTGEPTEGALRSLGMKAEFDHAPYERLSVIPFESDNKWMATLNRRPEGGVRLLLKGAPDRLLDLCKRQLGPRGSVEALDRDVWEERVDGLAANGQRVLAAAYREMSDDADSLRQEDLPEDLVFAGIVGILDPPRPEAIDAIATCHDAGIRVIMITGDHLATARSIGREMGIGDGEHAISGAELEEASDEELRRFAAENDVFARTSPEHKLRLVKALQSDGGVVAMTGDGVNDAPALKRADVGIAMGIKGSEATKEAADIVLADDNFASIERAVEEGRTIYDNLQKAILFLLPTNGAEALVILTAVIAGFALPLTPVQILWVNMVTAVTLAMALGFEPSEPGLMKRPPRSPGAPIIGPYFLWRIIMVSTLIGGATIAVFLLEQRAGMPIELARTVAVNTLVAGQLCYLFNSRYLREAAFYPARLVANRIALGAAGILIVLQLTFVYAPFMNLWFGSEPLGLRHWLIPLAIGLAVFVVAEVEKAAYRLWSR